MKPWFIFIRVIILCIGIGVASILALGIYRQEEIPFWMWIIGIGGFCFCAFVSLFCSDDYIDKISGGLK
jgi:hypothetical protein